MTVSVSDLQGRSSHRRYLANASVSDLLRLYANSTAAARRAVLRQLRLVNESLAELDAVPPHPTVDDLYLAAARSDSEVADPTLQVRCPDVLPALFRGVHCSNRWKQDVSWQS